MQVANGQNAAICALYRFTIDSTGKGSAIPGCAGVWGTGAIDKRTTTTVVRSKAAHPSGSAAFRSVAAMRTKRFRQTPGTLAGREFRHCVGTSR